jgi:hypothetical protein
MSRSFNRTLPLSTIIIITLLVFSIYAAAVPSVNAADIPIQEKAAQILSNATCFDNKTYQISIASTQNNQYLGKPTKEATLNLASSEGNLSANCVFINQKMQRMYISGYSDLPLHYKPSGDTVEAAKSFLQEYQKLDAQAIYGQCAEMMKNVDAKSNITKSAQNIRFAVTNFDDKIVDYSWMYVGEDGVVVGAKNVYLSFERGQLKTFINNWPFYTVVGSAKISGEQAITIAIEAVKNFSYEVTDGNITSTVSGFKVAPESIVNATLSYVNMPEADKARGGDPFTLYPSYYVPLGFDSVYPCGVTGVYVAVWADTGEVSVMSPMAVDYPETSSKGAAGKAPSQDVAMSTIASFALGSGASQSDCDVLYYRKGLCIPKVTRKRFGFRLAVALLCALILSGGALAAMPLASAANKVEAYGAIRNPNPNNPDTEKVACAEVCAYITTAFENAGYDASNYCPTKENNTLIGEETNKTTVLSNAYNDEENYDNVAVFSFGHLAGFNDAIQSGHLVDDEEVWDPVTNPTINITVSEVKAQTTQGKHFFVLIWHCVQAIDPYSGSMAAAWTQRDGSPGHPYMSPDGYTNPDPMGQCYIGFSGYSPMIAYDPFYLGIPGKTLDTFIEDFYGYALDVAHGYTVNQALDLAAIACFGNSSFSQCPLVMHDHDTWWPGGPPVGEEGYLDHNDPQYQSVMRVFGDGNVKLTAPPQMVDFTITAQDNHGNPAAGTVWIGDYAAGQTGMTLRIKAGTHTITVSQSQWYETHYFIVGGTQEYYTDQLTYNFAGDTSVEVRYVWYAFYWAPVSDHLIISVDGGEEGDGTTAEPWPPGPYPIMYYPEEEITITAVPDSGYKLDHWGITIPNEQEQSLGSEYNLTIPMQQCLITAYFTLDNYTLTVSAGSGGTTDPVPGNYVFDGCEIAQATADPDSGYVFDYWMLDSAPAGSNQPIYITMYDDHTLHAVFREEEGYELTLICGENGETDPEADVYQVPEGDPFNATADPDGGYAVYWLLDTELYSANQTVAVQMYADHTLEAVFVDEGVLDDFGNTDIFEEERVVCSSWECWVLGQVFTCPDDGFAVSMTAAVSSYCTGGGMYVRYAIYGFNDLCLVAQTECGEVEAQGESPDWQTLAFADPPLLEDGEDYVLVVAVSGDPYGVLVAYHYAGYPFGVEQELDEYYDWDLNVPVELLDPSGTYEEYSICCTVLPV